MTEADWLAATDPTPMLAFVRGRATDRKLRLFMVACCHRIRDALTFAVERRGVDVAERYADGRASAAELRQAWVALNADGDTRGGPPYCAAVPAARAYVGNCVRAVVRRAGEAAEEFDAPASDRSPGAEAARAAEEHLAGLLRDVVGNPFHPVPTDPSWLTSTVLSLARQMYDNRDFSVMPILADALQDAGCEDDFVLAHCRSGGPHARGCWVIDGLLGKR